MTTHSMLDTIDMIAFTDSLGESISLAGSSAHGSGAADDAQLDRLLRPLVDEIGPRPRWLRTVEIVEDPAMARTAIYAHGVQDGQRVSAQIASIASFHSIIGTKPIVDWSMFQGPREEEAPTVLGALDKIRYDAAVTRCRVESWTAFVRPSTYCDLLTELRASSTVITFGDASGIGGGINVHGWSIQPVEDVDVDTAIGHDRHGRVVAVRLVARAIDCVPRPKPEPQPEPDPLVELFAGLDR